MRSDFAFVTRHQEDTQSPRQMASFDDRYIRLNMYTYIFICGTETAMY